MIEWINHLQPKNSLPRRLVSLPFLVSWLSRVMRRAFEVHPYTKLPDGIQKNSLIVSVHCLFGDEV